MTDPDFYLNNHELWKLLQKRVAAQVPMASIAAELGVPVAALCEWIESYHEPRHVARYQGRARPSLPIDSSPMHGHWSLPDGARRFAAWRKAHDGARRTRLVNRALTAEGSDPTL